MRFNLFKSAVLASAMLIGTAGAQTLVSGRFAGSVIDTGWTLQGVAAVTAGPRGDAEGQGWLRLTGAAHQVVGSALWSTPFKAQQGLVLTFSYVSWGGGAPGADGLSVFLFDAAADMSGARSGGGLGYCQGAGGWLAVGLDEFGNFSNAADVCGNGPGHRPQSVVLRGPVSAGQPLAGIAAVPGGVDRPSATQRPEASQVRLELSPKPGAVGYRVNLDWRSSPAGAWRRLIHDADFPYAAPSALRLGIAGSTGGARNIHEVRDVIVRPLVPPRLVHGFVPDTVRVGQRTTLVIRAEGAPGGSVLLKPFEYVFPPAVKLYRPLQLGGTCRGELSVSPDGGSFTVREGTVLPPGGCSVTVDLRAESPGQWTVDIPRGGWTTEGGSNLDRSQSSLVVYP